MSSSAELKKFISKFDNFSRWDKSEQTDYIAFYLIRKGDMKSISAKDIQKCFDDLDLKQYERIPAYLSDNVNSKKGKYVKKNTGYRLSYARSEELRKRIENEPERVEVSENLEKLLSEIDNLQEKAFLTEALNCYRIQAFRATVVMVWILVIEHLKRYIFKEKLNEFNIALSKNPDKKVGKIISIDDFNELPESKLIELSKSAGVITSDVRKILDEKLGTRNSSAHPSGIEITGHKTTEFILDLIKNFLVKYK